MCAPLHPAGGGSLLSTVMGKDARSSAAAVPYNLGCNFPEAQEALKAQLQFLFFSHSFINKVMHNYDPIQFLFAK